MKHVYVVKGLMRKNLIPCNREKKKNRERERERRKEK